MSYPNCTCTVQPIKPRAHPLQFDCICRLFTSLPVRWLVSRNRATWVTVATLHRVWLHRSSGLDRLLNRLIPVHLLLLSLEPSNLFSISYLRANCTSVS